MPEWVKVAQVDECPPGELVGAQANGTHLVLANVDGDLYALEDRCSHQDYPLSDGELHDGTLECIYHGACFDVKTGEATQLPAIKGVRTYEVEVRGSEIYVEVE